MGEVSSTRINVAFANFVCIRNIFTCFTHFLLRIITVLASWFRLKYPHIALGALASSAPILYFDDITPQNGYYSIVTKDFKVIIKSNLDNFLLNLETNSLLKMGGVAGI